MQSKSQPKIQVDGELNAGFLKSEIATEIDKQEVESPRWIRILRIIYAFFSMSAMIILLRIWGEATPGYSWFYSMSWAIGFIPWFIIVLIIVRYCKWKIIHVPKAKLDNARTLLLQSTLVSFLLAVNYLGVSTSNPHISGPAQVVLSQLPTVFTLLFATFLLQRKYEWPAWAGAGLIFAGAVLQQLIPDLIDGVSNSTPISWALINILGMLPLGILPTCFEAFHKPHGSDGRRITAEYRLLLTNIVLIFWLILFIPLFGLLKQPPLDQFASENKHALQCVFDGVYHPDSGSSVDENKINCEVAGPVLLATLIIAAAQMHSQVLLSRGESGPMAAMILSLAPFFSDIFFPIKGIMGVYQEVPSLWTILGSMLCLIGTVIFVNYDTMTRKKHTPLKHLQLIQYFLKE